MPTFLVTDPTTGTQLRLTGNSPPSEQELEQIFAQQTQEQEILSDTGNLTQEGRPIFTNQAGESVTERTVTVTDPRINQGQPTNIPTVLNGQFLSQDDAIKSVVDAGGKDPITGRQLEGFGSIDEAVTAARSRSEGLLRPEPTFGEMFTGAERIAETPELGELPEFATTEEGDTFKIAAGLLSTFDEKAQREIIQEAIPEAVFETTADGSTIVEVPTREGGTRRSVINRPGLSPRDVATGVAQALAFIPAARIASLGKTVAQKIGLGGVAAGATEQALQETGVALGREERDPADVAIAAGLGGLAETIVPAVQGTREFLRARRAGVERGAIEAIEQPVAQAREAVAGLQEATGQEVGLFQAQQTLTPVELIKQRVLPQLDASSRTAASALERQNTEAFDATTQLINTIAPDQVIETGAQRFRNAASSAREARRIIRSETASPIYKQAFRRQRQGKTPLLNTQALENKINGIIRGSDQTGQIAGNLGRVGDKINTAEGNLQRLQSVKLEIDNLIEGRGDNALGRSTLRALTDVKNDLVDLMVEQSPSYRAARDEFIRLTPAIEELDNSLIGRISNIPDDQLKNVASKIFDPREINPTVLRNAQNVINDVDPGAWDDVVRVELERRLGGLRNFLNETGDEAVSNIPGQINSALFGNPKNRQVFMSALNPEQRRNFGYLETVLRRAMKGRAAGSPTTPFKEAIDKMRGVAGVLRDTIFRPVSTIQGVGEQSLFDRRIAGLAEAMFNPQWRPQMETLRALDPNSPAAARAMLQLLDDIESSDQQEER